MQMDYIDLYYCHRFDTTTPVEETLRALSGLVSQGKILYYGVSEEWGGARLEEAHRIIEKYNLYPMTSLQPQYNMADRYIEHEIMGICEKYGIGITPFSPLKPGCRGYWNYYASVCACLDFKKRHYQQCNYWCKQTFTACRQYSGKWCKAFK